MSLVKAFVVGGLFCVVGEILLLRTKLTSARILVAYVVAGVFLTAIGVYKPIVDFAGAGATVPLTGFGYSLAMGAINAVHEQGVLGAFSGGVVNTASGITAAILFGLLNALLFKPHRKP
ncbi:MAG: stage V sporulation protein AE [Clostridia bacterium]